MDYEAVIGLEVHARLKTKTKIFCSCSNHFGNEPNSNVCPVCLGMPGVLPVLNEKVVEYAIKLALATNCQILQKNQFARKNYFYPDLPKNYQISQYEFPIAEKGFLNILDENNKKKKIGITRIHLEEDAGKLIHDSDRKISFVDYNRTGAPLAEIVSEPDLRSAKEAVSYLKELHSLVKYIDVCDGNMEEGSFKCDANISIRPVGEKKLGTRTELKNINSFRYIEMALKYEINRQIVVLEKGEKVIQETRLWDSEKNMSFPMRSKEEANDYRYFPEPDLLPLIIENEQIEAIRKTIPDLPELRQEKFIEKFNLSEEDASLLVSDKNLADYFEEIAKHNNNYKKIKNILTGIFFAILKEAKLSLENISISPSDFAELIDFIDKGVINETVSKSILEDMLKSKKGAKKIIEEKKLAQLSNEDEIEKIIEDIFKKFPKEVEDYKNGKTKLLGFFVGQIMKESKGKANPKLVNQIIKDKL